MSLLEDVSIMVGSLQNMLKLSSALTEYNIRVSFSMEWPLLAYETLCQAAIKGEHIHDNIKEASFELGGQRL